MASYYYLSGYTTPAGVTDRAGVEAIQQQLNAQGASLKVDGIWGPKTDAAYKALNGNLNGSSGGMSYAQQQASMLNDFYQALLPMTSTPTISYTPRDSSEMRSEIATYLRPSYDSAIAAREAATVESNAALDADAWARGMGRSTYVTDVKQRSYAEEQADIARLEGEYAAALAQLLFEAIDTENARMLEVQQYNANLQAQASQAALSLATGMYGDYLAQQQALLAAASASSGGSGGGRKKSTGTSAESAELLLSGMTPVERWAVYNGATDRYKAYRDEIIAGVSDAEYAYLQRRYPGAK